MGRFQKERLVKSEPKTRQPKPDANPAERVEKAAGRVQKRAKTPADRTGELVREELEVSQAGISSPKDGPAPTGR